VKAALYARVSTTDKGQDPEMQIRELREYAIKRGWTAAVFIDRISSREKHRPELEEMLKLCRRRKIDAVLVYRFDRFARSMKELVNALEEFESMGIQFVSLHENVDTTTPQGKLIFGIFAAIAEFERSLIQARVLSGLANARAKGKRLGRPVVVVDAGKIVQMRAAGHTWEEICLDQKITRSTAIRAFMAVSKTLSKHVQ